MNNPNNRKLIILEVNEVPFKVYDHYIKNNPNSVLSKILNQSKQYITQSTDQGELHPWSTWPTFYRGVDNTKHQIKDIGENLSRRNKEYPPVWDILVREKKSVGVFASLHTHPLPSNVESYDFLVPDPFANGSQTHPNSLEPFQAFNLAMTKKSGRSVDKGIDKKAALSLLLKLPSLGIRLSTIYSTVRQLIEERLSPWKAVRRRTFQSILAFDLYLKLLKKTKPQFTTFFSNHVASAMHRYWAATFPEDYAVNNLPDDWIDRYKDEIPYCMKQLDKMTNDLFDFIKKYPEYKLVIGSSMGQEATEAQLISHELFMKDVVQFNKALGDFEMTPLSAMHPQYNFSVSMEHSDQLEKKLNNLTLNGEKIEYRRKNDTFFSIDLGYPNIEEFSVELNGESITLEQLGVEIRPIDDQSGGTAYHIPEGSLFIFDIQNPVKNYERRKIDLREVAPAILKQFGISPNPYMMSGEEVFN